MDDAAAERMRQQARMRVNRVWERLGRSESESPSDAYRRVRAPARTARVHHPARNRGCEECLHAGTAWLHLRVCLTCGHVGCCDSSQGHASAHFEQSGHPVMRSLEPGEAWRWCFVDDTLV